MPPCNIEYISILFRFLIFFIILSIDCGSKAGVNGYLLSLFEQVRDKNIKVCVISPGMVNTDMVTSFGKNHEDMIQVDDIAETISFVAKVILKKITILLLWEYWF